MMTMTSVAATLACIYATMTSSPMKTAIMMMSFSAMIFIIMYAKSGLSWFPLILYLLFTGGILMMFMVVSSVTPNKKLGKMKSMIVTIVMVTTVQAAYHSTEALNNHSSEMKWMFYNKTTMASTIFFIMAYFVGFLTFLSKSSSSLRTWMCQHTPIL